MTETPWSTKDVQAHYRVHRTTVWRWVNEGGCPCSYSCTGRMMFDPEKVDAWYKNNPRNQYPQQMEQ